MTRLLTPNDLHGGAVPPPRGLSAPRALRPLCLLFLSAFFSAAHCAEDSVLREKLEALLAEHNLPALTALAWRDGHIVAEAAAGVRRRGHPEKLTLDDRIHLGSDTKAMTATLVALAVENDKLQWSTTLSDVFATAIPAMLPEWKTIPLWQLLTHRAGVPTRANHALSGRARQSPLPLQRLEIASIVLARQTEHAAGAKYLYSNIGYVIAGAALEQVHHRPWEYLMREELFCPLGIASGGFGPPPEAWGHDSSGTPLDPSTPAADNPPFLGPAGTAHMTMRDWARFAALHVRGDSANPRHAAQLLSAAAFAHLHTSAPGETYAGGWGTSTRPWAKGSRPSDTGRILGHDGSNTMWYCTARLAPEIDFFVLVATNQGGPNAQKACGAAADFLTRHFARAPD